MLMNLQCSGQEKSATLDRRRIRTRAARAATHRRYTHTHTHTHARSLFLSQAAMDSKRDADRCHGSEAQGGEPD